MAIFMAFQSPELEILGLTTIFGNTSTEIATQNALRLVCNQLVFIFLCMMCFRCNFFFGICTESMSVFNLQKDSVRLQAFQVFQWLRAVLGL